MQYDSNFFKIFWLEWGRASLTTTPSLTKLVALLSDAFPGDKLDKKIYQKFFSEGRLSTPFVYKSEIGIRFLVLCVANIQFVTEYKL